MPVLAGADAARPGAPLHAAAAMLGVPCLAVPVRATADGFEVGFAVPPGDARALPAVA
ncbi:MAG: hypothetical protein H6709_15055 [Kofleriaceae bacterium]|nr:hypothetical protein [Kofleriaceae bacterium]